jgi:hypothetical protein
MLLFVFALVLVGCQSNDSTYDAAALNEARAAARTYYTVGKVVSVGRPAERKLCNARTYHSDPCVAVPTVHRFRHWKIHGEVFVWLERKDGRWRVVDSDYFTPELTARIEGASPAPPWLSP